MDDSTQKTVDFYDFPNPIESLCKTMYIEDA